jgi:hypothetical protein
MGRAIGIAAAIMVVACGGGSRTQRAPRAEAPAEAPAEPMAAVEPARETAAAPAPTATIAVMPPEAAAARRWPKLAAALEGALLEARVPGAVGRASKVPLDVVQISIECVDPSPRCHAAVASSLQADQLFFGTIDAPDGKPRVRVTRTARDGSVVGEAEETFESEDAAAAKVKALVDGVAGGGR